MGIQDFFYLFLHAHTHILGSLLLPDSIWLTTH